MCGLYACEYLCLKVMNGLSAAVAEDGFVLNVMLPGVLLDLWTLEQTSLEVCDVMISQQPCQRNPTCGVVGMLDLLLQ